MKKKDFLFVLISIIFFLIGGYFCFKSINSTKVVSTTEKSSANYVVCLKENNYYEDTCLNEGREYLSSLTNTIRINFAYNRISSSRGKVMYYVGTNLKISNSDNGKEIFNDEKRLNEKKEINNDKDVLNIVDSAEIKYKNYDDLVKKYSLDYELHTSAVLQVYLKMVEGKTEKIVSSVNIPINEQTYSITKEVIKSSENGISEDYKNELLIGIMAIAVSIIIILVTIIKNVSNKGSDFEQEVKRLLTEYDRVIAETKLDSLMLTGKELIEINDFMELVDVRDTIEKPIMYFRKSDSVRDFIVQDKDIIYRYRMIDKNNNDNTDDDPIATKIEYNRNMDKNKKLEPVITEIGVVNSSNNPVITEVNPTESVNNINDCPVITPVESNNEEIDLLDTRTIEMPTVNNNDTQEIDLLDTRTIEMPIINNNKNGDGENEK